MIYDPEFKPILEQNHTVILKGSDFPLDGKSYRCVAIDALPEYIKDWGSLTAGTWSTDNEDTNLELDTNELGQLRMMVLDDIKVRLKNPAPTTRWRTARTTFYLPQFPSDLNDDWLKNYLFRASEFYYFKDTTPRFDLYSAATVTVARVLFTGWKFKLESLPGSERGQFVLNVNAWPSQK
jgi:hypothetical protein